VVESEGDSNSVGSVDSDAGRRRRLTIIVGIALAFILAVTIQQALGTRAANDEIARVRTAASTAVVSVADIPASFYGGADPVAAALDLNDSRLSAIGAPAGEWCITVEVERVLVTRSIRFELDAAGRLSEVPRCPAP